MARTVAGTLLLPNGQPMMNARIYFVAKRTETVSIVEGANASFVTSAAGAYSQSIVNGFYSVSIEVPGDSSGTNPRRFPLGDVVIETAAATTLEALIIASNPPSDLPVMLLYEILADAQAAASAASASASAAAASAASISVGTGLTQLPNNTILNTRLGTTGNLGTAAQRNIGAAAANVPDTTQLNTRLGTTGNLGTLAQQNTTAVTIPGTLGVSGQTVLNLLRVESAAPVVVIKSPTAAVETMSAYISYQDSSNTEKAWLGFGAGDGTFGINNASRNVRILSPLVAVNGISVGNVANAGASVFDWYEEGSFTPTVAGLTAAGTATYSVRVGRWQREGNRVHFQISVTWSTHTGTGQLSISGFPFVTSSLTNLLPAFAIRSTGFVVGAGNKLQCYSSASASSILFEVVTDTVANASAIAVPAAGTLVVTGSYEV